LSGIFELGIGKTIPGTVVSATLKVKIPVVETLYCVTGLPLNKNVKGIV